MDRRLLTYYNRELQILREMGGEFSREYPKVAARLGMEGLEVADPYVERLLESFAFLAARVQMKLDAEFPRFTQHLMESVFPNYLAPTPSMAVVRLEPEPGQGDLTQGIVVPRGTVLRSVLGKGETTPCEYRTSQDTTLWPIDLVDAQLVRVAGSAAGLDLPALPEVRSGRVRAALKLRLRATHGSRMDALGLDKLALHLRGGEDAPARLLENVIAGAIGVVVRPTKAPAAWHEVLPRERVRMMGLEDDEALLPVSHRGFSGYRLLQEYFAFPQRFLFFEVSGLQRAISKCADPEIDVIILLDRADPALEGQVDAGDFSLFCTPAINLFPRRADRIHLSEREYEYLVVPDRTRPMDYEVHEITEVAGFGEGGDRARTFLPFYGVSDLTRADEGGAFFSLRRVPRQLSSRQQVQGPRSGYLGSEVFISLVDGREAPFSGDLRQLGIETWCTNRDLPLMMPVGQGRTDFTLISGAPVRSVRVVAGPTRPRPTLAEGETAWRLISLLSLHQRALTDRDDKQGAAALREMLALHGELAEPAVRKQVEGLRQLATRPVMQRVTQGAATSWVRGLEVTITFDEASFQGTGVFLLSAVLERFFARVVTLNSFTETVIRTVERGEVARWPARIGSRATL